MQFSYIPENGLKPWFPFLFTACGYLIWVIFKFFPGGFDIAGQFNNTSWENPFHKNLGCCAVATDIWQVSMCLDTEGIEFTSSSDVENTASQFLACSSLSKSVQAKRNLKFHFKVKLQTL